MWKLPDCVEMELTNFDITDLRADEKRGFKKVMKKILRKQKVFTIRDSSR